MNPALSIQRVVTSRTQVSPDPETSGRPRQCMGKQFGRAMGSIRSGIGLISGVNSRDLVSRLIALERAPVERLEQRRSSLQTTQTALSALEANLLTLASSIQSLGQSSNFTQFNVDNSDEAQLTATAGDDARPGTFHFQTLRTASTFQALSKGFANSDQQSVGTGTLTVQQGGQLNAPTVLDAFNGGRGVRRGVIRITDRAGNTADVDLSATYAAADVVDAINAAEGISVTASTLDGRFILTDTSGATASNLSVVDLGAGHAAEDLGLNKSVAAETLTGDDVFTLTGDFTLDQLNDGNGVRRLNGAPDIRITTADGTAIDVNLDDAFSLNDVITAINDHADNGGKVTAALTSGRLELTDNTTGGTAFQIEDINGTSVIEPLGLDTAAAGNVISGRRLLAGIGSVLLANLRGGQGIDNIGEVSLTDRTGTSATIDLTGAESLDEVLHAINSAESTGGTKLQLTAAVNSAGTGIEVRDTSGSTSSNLVIADVGGSTLAAQLGIAVDAAQDSVDSGSLNLRYLNAASSLDGFAPDGSDVDVGHIRIVDSAGNDATVEITSAVENIGDVLQRINAASTIQVRAELNETGDGFVLIDEAGGTGTLRVEDVDADTAADLKILGDGITGDDGIQRITSRAAAVISVDDGDTLDDVVSKINNAAGFVTASVFNDGSAFNAHRLMLTAADSGTEGRLLVGDSGLNLELSTIAEGQDALLRTGQNVESAFILASSNDSFENAATGIDVQTQSVGSSPAEVVVTRDNSNIEAALQKFVDEFNKFVEAANEQTKFDPETGERGPLQGQGIVLRARSRLDNLLTRRLNGFDDINSLLDVGIRPRADGTLEFDTERFSEVVQSNRAAVEDFLLRDEDGFADVANAVMETLTDPIDGAFALETNSLQQSADSLTDRIETLEELLAARQERLLREFAQMEEAIAALTSQQQALAGIAPLQINPVGTGIL